jgi:hypothetical protein
MSPIITITIISFKLHGIYANMDEALLLPVLLCNGKSQQGQAAITLGAY